MKKKIGASKSIKKYAMAGEVNSGPGKKKKQSSEYEDDLGDVPNWMNKVADGYKAVEKGIKNVIPTGVKKAVVKGAKAVDNVLSNTINGGKYHVFKKGGTIGKPKMAKGGSTSFGMLSVKAGVDNNPKPTAADRIAGAKMKKGGTVKKMQQGGVPSPTPPPYPFKKASPYSKFVGPMQPAKKTTMKKGGIVNSKKK